MPKVAPTAWTSPAFALVAAACARPRSPERDRGLAWAAADADWPAVVRLARRHRIEGLVHDALAGAGVNVPEAAGRELADRARAIAADSLMSAAETVRLQALFDQAGVANLMLKGVALERRAYGRLGLKSAWDIDLLVPPASAARARELLEGAGYRMIQPADSSPEAFAQWTTLAKECVFVRGSGGAVVELHWALVEGDLLPGLSIASPAETVAVAPGLAVRTLAGDALVAYLMVHGTSHGWSRLKWLADVNALLANGGPAEIERLYRRAVDLGAGVCPAVTVRLCRRLFALPIPPRLAREFDRDVKAAWLERLALNAMAGGKGRELADRPFMADAILMSRLLFDHGWPYRRREFARQWTSLHDRTHLDLPAPLAFVYHLVRAPLWAWRRIRR